MTGLYIHIPLCISRCRYCDFYTLTPSEWDNIPLFLEALERELARLPKSFAPETVFIGGGTPTALKPGEYAQLLEAIHRQINLSNVVEFSSEANPGTLGREKLEVMRQGGVNRISMGVQSFNDRALQLLGRAHSAATAIDGYRMVRDAGFENVNIDLIQSIPRMSPMEVLADVRQVVALGPEHISYYNLIYEPGTPLTAARDAGQVREPGDDEEADNYFAIKALLKDAGYDHYEISNFSKSGRRCLQNVLYWQSGEYFGCGPSAHSHWQGKRYGNVSDLATYCDRLLRGKRPFDEVEVLSSKEKAHEVLVMGLRMNEGIDLDEFKKMTGWSVEALCGPGVDSMLGEGLLQQTQNRISLTENSLFISNSVFSELI